MGSCCRPRVSLLGVIGSIAVGGVTRIFPSTAGIDISANLLVVPLLVAVTLLAAYIPADAPRESIRWWRCDRSRDSQWTVPPRVRRLTSTPGPSLVILTTLAIAIGATTIIASTIDGVWHAIPAANTERLVFVASTDPRPSQAQSGMSATSR